jgi:hypothetical protein
MINPVGLSYLLLDKNNRYNHKKALATINTTTSETKPKEKILMISIIPKLDCVIGWKRSTILSITLTNTNNTTKLIKGEYLLK